MRKGFGILTYSKSRWIVQVQLVNMPRPVRYSAIAEGIDEIIVVGIWGDGSNPTFGLFWDKFEVRGQGPADGCIDFA
jgi:hypothetical protein